MRVLVFHGYLLQGTGSNVYNANLAAALVRLGHEVHLLCQDRAPQELDFVDAVGDWDAGELRVRTLREPLRCTVYRPALGGLLPVYVADRYEGIEARPFPELSEAEVDAYVAANVRAVREVVARARPDVALANHLVMGPLVLARALDARGGSPGAVPYAVKVHGSALEYTVKPHPRFLPAAREGVARARAVLVGSRHVAQSLWAALDDPALRARTRLGPPGVDVARFAPREPAQARAGVAQLADALARRAGSDAARSGAASARRAGSDAARSGAASAPGGGAGGAGRTGATVGGGDAGGAARTGGGVPGAASDPQASAFARDERAAADALASLAAGDADDRLVAFVGKLIVSKGVDLLLAAWPLVLAAEPRARLVVVGFGAYREAFERLLAALAAGDLDAVAALAAEGRAAEGGPRAPLRLLQAFLASLDGEERARYLAAARALPARVVLTGRLDHDELAELLPACEALVVPSTFPEAFGMVAAEAAACGALPLCAAHSGLAEVADALAERIPPQARPWLVFPLGPGATPEPADAARVGPDATAEAPEAASAPRGAQAADPVRAIAERLVAWLAAPPPLRAATRAALVETARERWSWEGVARGVIAAAEGRIAELPAADRGAGA